MPSNFVLPSATTPHACTCACRDAAAAPRPGSSVPPSRTKTIAVASHCPPELLPQPPTAPWTIDDFTLLRKLYEGSLSVVCQVGVQDCHRAGKVWRTGSRTLQGTNPALMKENVEGYEHWARGRQAQYL